MSKNVGYLVYLKHFVRYESVRGGNKNFRIKFRGTCRCFHCYFPKSECLS